MLKARYNTSFVRTGYAGAQLCVRTSEERNVGGWFSAVRKSTSLQAQIKDPFASRNSVLFRLVGIREVSDSAVRQAVFVVRPIVGA